MNILFVAHDSNLYGGANIALLEIIDSMKIKNNCSVLVPNKNGKLISELEGRKINYIVIPYKWWTYRRKNNNIVNFLKMVKVSIYQFITIINIPKLIRYIRQNEIEIIHTNSSVINVGALTKKIINIIHIWHIREFAEEHYNLAFYMGKKKSKVFMDKYSDGIITISNSLKNKYCNELDNRKIYRVYDGVSLKYDLSIKREPNYNSSFIILITGTIYEGKGQHEVVQAVVDLINLGYKIELLIAGKKNDKAYFEEIMKLIEVKKMNSFIKYLGEIKNINEIRKKVDVEVVCSYKEAFGRVTIEAMLAKLPVIVSNSGANPELVNDKCGLIYEKGNIEDLKNKIKILYNDRDKCIEMGNNGYEFSRDSFTSEINCENILKVYEDMFKKEKI